MLLTQFNKHFIQGRVLECNSECKPTVLTALALFGSYWNSVVAIMVALVRIWYSIEVYLGNYLALQLFTVNTGTAILNA